MTYFNGENDDTSKALDSGVPVLDWLRSGWKHHLKWSNDVLVDRSPIKRCRDLHFGESSIKVLGPKKNEKRIPSGYVKIAIENGHRNSGFSH